MLSGSIRLVGAFGMFCVQITAGGTGGVLTRARLTVVRSEKGPSLDGAGIFGGIAAAERVLELRV